MPVFFFHLYPFNQVLLSRECWTCLFSFLQEEIWHLHISMCNTDMSDHRLHMSHTELSAGRPWYCTTGIDPLQHFLCVLHYWKRLRIWLRPLGSCSVAPMYSHGMLSEGACFFNHLSPDAPNWWASKLNIYTRWKTSSRKLLFSWTQ